MMSSKDKIIKELKNQQLMEGYTSETGLLLKIAKLVRYSSEWQNLTKVKHIRREGFTYKYHHFYYPSPLLLKLQKLFEGNNDEF